MRVSFLHDQAKELQQFLCWTREEVNDRDCEHYAAFFDGVYGMLNELVLGLARFEASFPTETARPGDYNFFSDAVRGTEDPEIIRHIKPETLRAIQDYVQLGVPLGDFLTAVIEDKLTEALGRADEENRARLYDITRLLYNYCPSDCWGSRETRQEWQRRGGLQGIHRARPSDELESEVK